MKTIRLTQGKVAMVDDADFEWLSQYKWHTAKRTHLFYAVCNIPNGEGNKTKMLMHQMLVGRGVDHIDGNGLNNTRANLRHATRQQNNFNKRIYRNNTSGFKGVTWNRDAQKWKAYIRCGNKQKFIGYFDDPIKAAYAYNEAAKQLFGEFSRLNEVTK